MKILSFGAGIQTTAIAVLIKQGKITVDMAVFADTGGEKPETYWYIENYIKELFQSMNIPFVITKRESGHDLYGYLWQHGQIPPIQGVRLCSIKYKSEAVRRSLLGKNYQTMIGFSVDEINRSQGRPENIYPLLELNLTANDCRQIITGYGLPLPLKSSCYFCPFQTYPEWNWLKNTHHDLFEKALQLEANYHVRKPHLRSSFGLLRGTPLWKITSGFQPEMLMDIGQSCWSGYCSH